jgi:hypothetical protein
MSTTQPSSTDVCDGENLAIILALYWVVYLIINAVILAAAMYALRKCLNNDKRSGHKKKDPEKSHISRSSSRIKFISEENR